MCTPDAVAEMMVWGGDNVDVGALGVALAEVASMTWGGSEPRDICMRI